MRPTICQLRLSVRGRRKVNCLRNPLYQLMLNTLLPSFFTAAKVMTPLVFTAELGTTRNYNAGDIIHFNRILADFGSMYDRDSGIVTVPQHGIYSISVRLASAAKTESSVLSFESRFPPLKLSI